VSEPSPVENKKGRRDSGRSSWWKEEKERENRRGYGMKGRKRE
jgi:hypothetical protein